MQISGIPSMTAQQRPPELYPLSLAQEGLWLLQRLDPGSNAYHLTRAFHLRGPLDADALERALHAVRSRHAVLRTRFVERAGVPQQWVQPAGEFSLARVDLARLPATEGAAALEQQLAQHARQPFDLSAQDPIRFRLFVLEDERHVLAVTAHHIASDGASNAIFARELAQAYNAALRHELPEDLPALESTYTDFSSAQRLSLDSAKVRADLAYWTGYLASADSAFELPHDFARASAALKPAQIHSFSFSATTLAAVTTCCRAERCTPFVVLMAAWQSVLWRYSGRDDFCIGVPTSGRTTEESEALIGLFVDTQVYRARLAAGMTGRALLDAVRHATRAALDHGGVPLSVLADALSARREADRPPLFQTLFNVQGESAGRLCLDGLEVEVIDVENQNAKFDLSLDLRVGRDALVCTARYDAALYHPETIARLGRHYEAMVLRLCSALEQPLANLPLLDSDELVDLLSSSTQVEDYGDVVPVHRLIEAQASATPDAIALMFDDVVLSYSDLEQRANRLAHRLIRAGVGPDMPVGICLERSVELVVGLLAILKAGGAYVPLDPDYPLERLSYMMADSGLGLLLTQHAVRPRLPLPAGAMLQVLELDRLDLSDESPLEPAVALHADNLAYVIYTSGSTGRPKGAANRHGALFNRLVWMQAAYLLDASDTVLQKTPFSFDVSVWEFFWPLMFGARLALAPPGAHREPTRLLELIDRFQVTTLHFVPPMLQAFVTEVAAIGKLEPEPAMCASLRRVICSGEALPAVLQDRALQHLPQVQLINLYGPTEAAIDVTHWTCRAGDPIVPIGRPIANLSTHVLDPSMNPLPRGIAGELYLGGAGLARGYLNRPGLTAERFVPDPLHAGERLYRTGDLARWRDDGALDYLGRIDHQVKLRGFRIELGEIEAQLQALDGVDQAVVLAQPGPNGLMLVAYVVVHAAARAAYSPHGESWAAQLLQVLPDYMVPSAWVVLDTLPLSPNGKVERRALPLPQPSDSREPVQGELESMLARVWQEVLRVEQVGRHCNFFELGGDSILSLQIVERARRAGWRITPRQLFERQTVARLAAVAEPVCNPLVPAQVAPDEMGDSSTWLPMQAWFFELALQQRHHWNQAVLLNCPEPLDRALLEQALHRLVQHHAALRLRFTQHADGRWLQAAASDARADDLLRVARAVDRSEIESLCDEVQGSLNLAQGPLLRALKIDLADGGQRLLLVIHHLVVDGVSWRILLDDLHTAYAQLQAGSAVRLPAETTSCRTWAARLGRYARSPEVRAQLGYWQHIAATSARIPCDMSNGANTAAQLTHTVLAFDRISTQRLLQEAPAAYRTQINDLLLTALGRALCTWTGGENIRIDLEGHGREDHSDDLDLSRTVGWFTSLYPVCLAPQGEIGAALKRVKQSLREVPDRGLGFALLKYLGEAADRQALSQIEPAQVVFNYLGQFDQSYAGAAAWQLAPESTGCSQDAAAPLPHSLSISGRVVNAELRLSVAYSSARYASATIDALMDSLRTELEQVVAHCTSGVSGATPADFELASLTQHELDRLPLNLKDVADLYPLSPMQAGMVFHTLYAPGGAMYLNQLRLDIDGLDVVRFAAAWAAVTARHDILRTGFVPHRDGWLQWVSRAATVPLQQHDWRCRDDLEDALTVLAQTDLANGFDLARPPLQRLTLVRIDSHRYHLVWTHHHVLMDGWSVSQLLGEVLRHYSGQSLPAQGGRYRDYIGWLQQRDTRAGENYWREQLAQVDQASRLAEVFGRRVESKHAHKPEQTPSKATYAARSFELDPAATAALAAFARQQRVTVNTLIQAAWTLLLQRYTGRETVVFGATVAGRPAAVPGVSQVLGLFINTLPVIARPQGGQRLGEWLRELQEQGVALQEHAYTPLYEIQRWAGSQGAGLFDSLLVFENYPVDAALQQAAPGGLTLGRAQARDETNYPLSLGVTQGKTLKLAYRFACDAFSESEVMQIGEQMLGLLDTFTGAADRTLAELPLLHPAQQQDLLALGRNRITPQQALDVHSLIAARAALQPDAIAVVAGEVELSYAALNIRANRLAHRLIRAGVGPEVRVGFAVGRSVEMIVGLLAILKAGGAYVPLDPAYPAQRLEHMICDSGIGLLLTQSMIRPNWSLPESVSVLELDALDLSGEAEIDPQVTPHAENLAYVIYTSGSTGQPKGVAVAHGALAMHCQTIAERYEMTAADRELQFASINFDIAHERWIVPLLAGGAIVIADPVNWSSRRLIEELKRQRISVMFLTPSYINPVLADPAWDGQQMSLRLCIVGGEAWAAGALQTACHKLGTCRVINAYGPTETVIAPTAWNATLPLEGAYAPIGRPLGDRTAYVLDSDLNLAPAGVAGELYLGGAGLARGYLNRPGLTAERFVPDPFAAGGARLYRTGDQVRWRTEGELAYLGRLDHQVKIRGFRIELGEIEAGLLAQAGVRDAAVTVHHTVTGARLLGYVTAQIGAVLDVALLKAGLGQLVPDYMVPSSIVVLDVLPLTPNGKVDRHALPAQDLPTPQLYQAPSGEVELVLAQIWSEVLGVPQVGRVDNFFELGGDSILSLQVQRRIARDLCIEVELAALFSAPTLEALAGVVAAARLQAASDTDAYTDVLDSILTELMP